MKLLEGHYHDMCDIEFTVEQGRLFMLQTRVGKRTAAAALRMAVEMVHEGLIDEREAVLRVQPAQLDQLLHPQFDPKAEYKVLAKGLNASPGAAVGKVYFTADEAEARHEAGDRVILVRPETSPDDLHGMIAAEGILTSRGGLVSHAAVVARGMGKPAICGAEAVVIDLAAKQFVADGQTVREGDVISISGTSGEIVLGEVAVITPEPTGHFGTILGWADQFRRLRVRTNADLPEDAKRAREFGAEGIGLCRTEHMFLGDRLPIVQRMILADNDVDEAAALEELRAQQESDFVGILEAMDGLPVTVRLLDPPLHEFLPDVEELLVKQAKQGLSDAEAKLLRAAEYWREANPMLGTRGCRLGILKPGLYRMQVRALMQAAVTRRQRGGNPIVEIMIPLIVTEPELKLLEGWTREEADAVLADAKIDDLHYVVGTMVETPRAALVADRIAETAEFFSFGTNDLTQMTFGFSRDDVEGRFMAEYLELKLLPANPFDKLDVDGVGQLVRMGCERGRASRPDLKLGICGEHGGDPDSVAFCHEVGLDYVSCSPFRVPIARLAAAHAALGNLGPGATA
jgi:pyruvate,orthophosphate dikinase